MNPARRSWWSLGILVALGAVVGVSYAALAQDEDERGEREQGRGEARREVREREERPRERPERERREAEERERPSGERPAAELMRKRQQLEQQAQRIKRALGELRDDQDDEARKLQAQLREVETGLARLRQAGRVPEEMRQRMAKVAELRRALAMAMRERDEEKANEIRKKLQELAPGMGARPERLGPPQVRPEVLREIEQMKGQIRELNGHMQQMHQRIERLERLLRARHDDEDDEEDEDEEERGDDDEEDEDDDEEEEDD